MWHGPHHGAHASSSTGTGECSTSWTKLASLTGCGVPAGSGVLHLPQTGASPCATLSPGTRLMAPQAGQTIIGVSLASAPGRRVGERELGELGPVHLDDEGNLPLGIPPGELLARVLPRGDVLHREGPVRAELDHPAAELGLGVGILDVHDRERHPGVPPRVPRLERALA